MKVAVADLNIRNRIEEIASKSDPDRNDILFLLNLDHKADIDFLFDLAARITAEKFSEELPFLGSFQFSNYCEANCLYCSLREENFSIDRYRFPADKIIDAVKKVSNMGLSRVILESGQDSTYDTDLISYIIFTLKQYSNELKLYLSLGERGFDEYKTWKYSGIDGYVLSHNTSNPEHYGNNQQRRNLNQRVRHLQYIKRIGLEAGTGIIIGLPNQSVEDIAGDILLSRELDSDILMIQPFVPRPFTPYQHKSPGNPDLLLKSIAAARIILKKTNLPFYLKNIRYNPDYALAGNAGINLLLCQIVLIEENSKIIKEKYSNTDFSSRIGSNLNNFNPIRIYENRLTPR